MATIEKSVIYKTQDSEKIEIKYDRNTDTVMFKQDTDLIYVRDVEDFITALNIVSEKSS